MTEQEILVNEMQDAILEALGAELAYNELCKALDIDTRQDMFDWIIRCYDIPMREE